ESEPRYASGEPQEPACAGEGVGERGIGTAGHTGTFRPEVCEDSWPLEKRAADGRGGVQINRAFISALRVKEANTGERRQDEKKGDLPVPPNEGTRNEGGRAMSSRSVVIVLMKRGKRTEGTLT
ncbi:MAG: hypothetical protein LBK05_02590, partial [Treponema sp.]|nr:hypothetical protein [Treponema sp.]